MSPRSVEELVAAVESDPDMATEIQEDPVGTITAFNEDPAYVSDPSFYRIAILGLIGIIAGVLVAAVLVLLFSDETVPDWMAAIAATALGGLVGLFAPSPAK